MALIKCEECGKLINDNLKTCPNCGYPIEFFSKNNELLEIENKFFNEIYKEPKNGNEKSVNAFFIFSTICLVIGSLAATIFILWGIDIESVSLAIIGIAIFILALITTYFFKWMAYVLKNVYEIKSTIVKNNERN